jgi:antitoxin CcdA
MRMAPAHARRATNVSIDPALIAEARALDLNLSKVLEDRLRELVAAERRRKWLEENEAAFAAYDRFVERVGIFNEDEREW